ncbi:MAG TPA: penicillin acylase family protein [Nocardioidaceae bacterium]|nr:penicillin acylase family protein [Nocardioidaceae bacterium]
MGFSRRATALLASLALLPALTAVQVATAPPQASASETPLRPADGVYRATVKRTKHGIPHVVAKDFGSLGFGHGFATAETSICSLADTLLTARGERSRYLGPDRRYNDQVTLNATNRQTDALLTDIHNRKVVERLLRDPKRGPSAETKAIVRGYVAGINDYLRSVGGAKGIKDPSCRGARWITPTARPIDLWYGVYAANLLASTGVFVPQIVSAAPPSPGNPNLPSAPVDADFAEVPDQLPSRRALLKGLGKDPDAPFGSNATAVGSAATTTGRGMVLGNPHFPWRGRYRFAQAHLTIPGEYDVAGASLIGSPVVNIGFNRNVAWSHTVSTAYRFTPYEYPTVAGSTTYLTAEGPRELERREVSFKARAKDGTLKTVTEDLYRTDEGYVLHAPDVLMSWTPASFFALRDANAEHLRTIDTFHNMAKAGNVRELLAAQDRGSGMPWVNTIAADRAGNVLYADHSVVPNVPNDLAEQCMTPVGRALFEVAGLPGLDGTRASGDCAWRTDADATRPGIFGPKNLPHTFRKDWVVNANDSYWLPNPEQRLEGFARIIGCEACERTLRTRVVYRYVMDRLAGTDKLARNKLVSHRTLKRFEHENRVFGAEVARENGDLQAVCESAGGGKACEVLAKWDGRSDVDSVGTHIFQEFWKRAQGVSGLWQVPFDAADPVGTPRDLNEANPLVVQAMADALAFLDEKKVAYDAPWGSLQVAGDDGAPPIPIGGGEGYAGNANAVASRGPVTNLDRLYPVTYGSSHIQAVAFTDRGVDADTILTYGQSLNRRSVLSSDQTRLFSQERWVDFAFTPAQIRRALVRSYRVSGRA